MRKANLNLEKRRIEISPDEARHVILGFFEAYGLSDVQSIKTSSGYRLIARGDPSGRFFFSPSPRILLSADLINDGFGYTIIHFSKEKTPQFENWYPRGVAGGVCIGVIILALFIPLWQIRLIGVMGLLFIAALELFILIFTVFAVPLEKERIEKALTKMEHEIWHLLEQTGHRLLIVSESHRKNWMDDVAWLVAPVISVIPWALFLSLIGFRISYFAVVLFIMVPLWSMLLNEYVSHRLPFRYQWKAVLIDVNVFWFFCMCLPFAMESIITEPSMIEAFRKSPESIDRLIDKYNAGSRNGSFVIAASLIIDAFIWLIWISNVKINQRRYGSFLESPSEGYEEIELASLPIRLHKITVVIIFILLSIGTLRLVANISLKLMDPIWRTYLVLYYIKRPAGPTLLGSILLAPFLLILISPIILTVGGWGYRLLRSFITMVVRRVSGDEGRDFFESSTRVGLFDKIKEELGAKKLAIRRASSDRLFGASIEQVNVFSRTYVLIIDSNIFHIWKPKELEAVVWHEVWHIRQRSFAREFLGNILFNVWCEQAKDLLVDSLKTELAADEFAVNRMDKESMDGRKCLHRALDRLRTITEPVRSESYISGVKSLLKILLGSGRLSYYHPHLDLRLAVLAEKTPQSLL